MESKQPPIEKKYFDCIISNDYDGFCKILNNNRGKFNINCTQGYGMTGLMYAADRGFKRITAHFLEKCDSKCEIEKADDFGQTALHFACYTTQYNVCEMLLAAGAKVNAKSVNNQTPLLKAVHGGCKQELVQLLLYYKADVDVQNSPNKMSALMLASINNNLAVVQVLRRAGAKIELTDDEGNTALLLAAKKIVVYIGISD